MSKIMVGLMATVIAIITTVANVGSAYAYVDDPEEEGITPSPSTPSTSLGNPFTGGSGGGGQSSGGGSSSSGGPSSWGFGLLILAIALTVGGITLLHKGNLRWGIPFLVAGLGSLIWALGGHGLGFTLNPVHWSLVFWVLCVSHALSKITTFTNWDDRIVSLGSLGGLLASLLAKGWVPASINPFSPSWWALECIWVFWGADALLKSKGLEGRKILKVLIFALVWAILGILS